MKSAAAITRRPCERLTISALSDGGRLRGGMWCERPRDYYRRVGQRFRGTRILDVGCGKKKFPGALGIDVRSNVSADVPHDLDQLPWPFEDNFFDLVLIRHCLEHLKDVVGTMEELWRVTRSQGTIVVEVPHFSFRKNEVKTPSS